MVLPFRSVKCMTVFKTFVSDLIHINFLKYFIFVDTSELLYTDIRSLFIWLI
jgi:hypothetical protein